MIKPTFEEAKALSRGHTVVPIALEILSDQKTPIEILRTLRRQSERCFILESVNGNDSWGRYSFLGYKPVTEAFGAAGAFTVKNGLHEAKKSGGAVAAARELASQYRSPRIPWLPPFTGGLVGYIAYDAVRDFMPGLELRASDEAGFRDFHFMLVDKLVAFDHFKQKIYIIANIPAEGIENSYIKGAMELKDIERMILGAEASHGEPPSLCGDFTPLFTESQFAEQVGKVKARIAEGDICQAVISNRWSAPFQGSLLDTYRALRTINPSPYMVYMRLDDIEIACSSPETLIALRDGEISSFPLAGTCARGATEEEDAALAASMLGDEKELAEHDMLVDLARSDIGKASRYGSVAVSEYRQVKRFSHVSHISSHVKGKLREGLDALDVIAAALPAGTLSGAPKKRACEIIDECEGAKRGVYGGAIGYIDFAGNMDMCIAIRMAVLKGGTVFVQAGAGVVADSVPENEYRETQRKSQAVMEALKTSAEA